MAMFQTSYKPRQRRCCTSVTRRDQSASVLGAASDLAVLGVTRSNSDHLAIRQACRQSLSIANCRNAATGVLCWVMPVRNDLVMAVGAIENVSSRQHDSLVAIFTAI